MKEFKKPELSNIYNNPYKILIACLLSLRTKDKITEIAVKNLFSIADTPEKMIELTENEIEKLIYPVGFYRKKAKTIKKISKILVEKYNSQVPDNINELLKLKGVGRKTANIVITFGFNKPGIAVDTHVHRISNRLGIVNTKNPKETEFLLMKILPKKYWIEYNTLLVTFGQNICLPVNPRCSICKISKYCKKVGVKKFS